MSRLKFQGVTKDTLKSYIRMRTLALPDQGEDYQHLDRAWQGEWDALPESPIFVDRNDAMRTNELKSSGADGEEAWAQE